MEIGPDKTRIMTANPNGIQREIKIKRQRLEEVKSFKYLGAIISNEEFKLEIFPRFSRQQLLFLDLTLYGGTRTSLLLLKLTQDKKTSISIFKLA